MAPMDAASTLRHMVFGFRLTQLVGVVAQLGVPDALRGGARSAADLAAAVAADARSLHRVLGALPPDRVFVEQPDGRFALTSVSELLCSDHPSSMRDIACVYAAPWLWRAYGELVHSVRSGESAFERAHGEPFYSHLQRHADAAAAFQRAMRGFTAHEIDAIVATCQQIQLLAGVRRMVDVGGGHGALVMALLQAHPRLHGEVFDTADAVAAACKGDRNGERLAYTAGDFFEAVPAGADVYVMKSVLHNWRDEPARAILRSCRRAMHETARLLIVERLIEPGPKGMEAKRFDVNMLVTVGGLERSAPEYATLLQAAGLRLQRVLSTSCVLSVLEAAPG